MTVTKQRAHRGAPCRGCSTGHAETPRGYCDPCWDAKQCEHDAIDVEDRIPINGEPGDWVEGTCDWCRARIGYHLLPDGTRVDVTVLEVR